jgi:hypothetical protein
VRVHVALVLLVAAAPLSAQRDQLRVDIHVTPSAALVEGPAITSENALSEAKTREHLLSGFPARIHYTLELWQKGGVFDRPAGREEWNVLVAYDPTTQLYNAVRSTRGDKFLENFGGFASVTSADAQISKPFHASLHPSKPGRFYYHLIVEMETLSESDLDALQQWLRGSTSSGKTGITVLRTGIGTLLSRILGGSTRIEEKTSEEFQVP